MTIAVDLKHRLGTFRLEARFEGEGPLTALYGPSGSGKTSLVNLIAGLIRPDAGRIVVDGRVLVDTGARIFVPAHRRRIGYVFQDARLFPHLTVAQNLAYGRFFTPATERGADAAAVIELLGIRQLLERRPGRLSGGEKQRVAIGRALLASPRLILMDEPLASLDDARKAEILPYIERLRDEGRTPIVYVSHSVAEVVRLATEVVVLDDGRVAAHGPTSEVLQQPGHLPPRERGEAGTVLVTTVEAHDDVYDMTVLASPAGPIRVPRLAARPGSEVRLHVRARDVMVATERPHGLSALNVLEGKVSAIGSRSEPLVEVRIDCNGEAVLSRITRQSLDTLGLAPGKTVFAVVKSVAFDQDGGPTGASLQGE